MIYRYCENVIKSGEHFCRVCGKPAEQKPEQSVRRCAVCGAELRSNDAFCRRCGTPVNPSAGEEQTAQTRQSAASRHNQVREADEKAELKRRTEILVIAAQGGDSSSLFLCFPANGISRSGKISRKRNPFMCGRTEHWSPIIRKVRPLTVWITMKCSPRVRTERCTVSLH